MIGVVALLAGIGCGIVGWLLLRRSGLGWRIGRLLAAAPQRSLEEAARIASSGESAYVRLHGRIDSAEEFPGEDGTPLVFRRRRLQLGGNRGGWRTFDDERLAVPFGLTDRGERVAIDVDALGDGLVVVPRESIGVAADLTPEAVAGALPDVPPETPVRLRVERVAATEHATAAGVPVLADDGTVRLGPGLGRPLVLTTLETGEAMRVLAADRRTELLLAAALLAAAPVLAVIGAALMVLGG